MRPLRPKSPRFTIASSSADRWRRWALPTPWARSAISTLPAAVSHGNSAGSWNMNATPRLPAPSPAPVDTSPEVGCSRPATSASKVDLPQPDAPIRQVNSPGATSSDT